MKKVILTGVVLLTFAAAAFAQTTQQNGNQQFARQNQTGNLNVGLIQQLQNNTIANGQNYGNYAITFQGMPNNSSPNFLTITQNDGSQGNRAGISQNGGPNLTATIQQNGGPDGLSGGATSVSATQSARGEDGNFAGILQIGSNSTATITENNNSRRNSAEIYQNGSGNQATTNQSNNSVSNSAFVFQGFTGQNIIGSSVNNAVATIQQGKVNAGDMSVGGPLPESVGSTAIITQTASNVTATIYQGSNNPSIPNGSGRASGASARISQSAIGTTATILQGVGSGEAVGSMATITQTAANQTATVLQGSGTGGSDNQSVVSITQSGAGSVTPSVAIAAQGASAATDRDEATILQTGAVVNAYALVRQGVNSNVVTPNGGGGYSSQDKASITQSGNGVIGVIAQNGRNVATGGGESNGRDNTASITQGAGVIGNGAVSLAQNNAVFAFNVNPTATGVAVIEQGVITGAEILQTSRNSATISQVTGTGLRAHIVQGGVGTSFADAAGNPFTFSGLNGNPVTLAGTVANDNTARIDQLSGDNHNASIFQTGRFNTANITQQNGSLSTALIAQTSNSERALAIINQTSTGTGNQATILQFAGSNADGRGAFGNQAIINQTAGSNNIAFLQQGQQGAGVVASSNDNFAQVTQQGSTNSVRFAQIGNNNFVDITQIGNNNQIRNALSTPGSFGLQQGYNNRLTLVQNSTNSSNGFIYNYTQIGNNNIQEVNQVLP